VIYASCGELRGGNSAFAFIGHYNDGGTSIQVKVLTERHNEDPAFKPLFGTDRITLGHRAATAGRLLPRHPDADQRLSAFPVRLNHAASQVASWFETREHALLSTRV
jgi:hypothetical protein